RQVVEQAIEAAAIERTTWDVLSCVGKDSPEVDVQRREYLFEMIGAAVEVVRTDLWIDRVGSIAGEGGNEFSVCQPHRICGLRRPSARHQLANCRSNALSLSHG